MSAVLAADRPQPGPGRVQRFFVRRRFGSSADWSQRREVGRVNTGSTLTHGIHERRFTQDHFQQPFLVIDFFALTVCTINPPTSWAGIDGSRSSATFARN